LSLERRWEKVPDCERPAISSTRPSCEVPHSSRPQKCARPLPAMAGSIPGSPRRTIGGAPRFHRQRSRPTRRSTDSSPARIASFQHTSASAAVSAAWRPYGAYLVETILHELDHLAWSRRRSHRNCCRDRTQTERYETGRTLADDGHGANRTCGDRRDLRLPGIPRKKRLSAPTWHSSVDATFTDVAHRAGEESHRAGNSIPAPSAVRLALPAAPVRAL